VRRSLVLISQGQRVYEKAPTKKGSLMRRLIVPLCGALFLALMVVTPAASARSASGQSADPSRLAAGWWKWALKKPVQVGPLLDDYSWKGQPRGAAKCAGGSRPGVFNLAGEFALDENAGGFVGEATRTCKVPAGKPIFFPVFNFICSPATNDTGDLQECATSLTNETLPASNYFVTVGGESVPVERVASGPFAITVPKDNVLGAPPGSYPAATDGLWVYLPEGLQKGKHVITFGGTFPTPFGTLTLDITYNIIVK
jgi:hypothetical protein